MKSLQTSLKQRCILPALALLFGMPLHAHAVEAAHGTGTLSNLHYTLTDLNPNDGIAPGITWTRSLTFLYGNYNDVVGSYHDESDGTSTISGSWENGRDATSATITGGAGYRDTELSVSHYSETGRTLASTSLFLDFTLTAETGIIFYSDYALNAYNTDPDSWADSYTAYSGELMNTGSSTLYYQYLRHESSSEFDQELNGNMALFYDNVNAENWTGTLNLWLRGSSSATAAPVPEPSTYAMFAAGFALLGVRANRRKRRA
jgi:hypothetical protein